MKCLITPFYEWTVDEKTGYRKIIVYEVCEDFHTELSRFKNWIGDYKECRYCHNSFPESEYFFKLKGKRGLSNKCKVCDGYKPCWGKKQKLLFIEKGMKYCQKCDFVLPLNDLYFVRNVNDLSIGYSSYCKKCVSGSEYGINRILTNIVDIESNHKVCMSCMLELPLSPNYFFKCSRKSDGFEHICKECQGVSYGVQYKNKVLKDMLPIDHKFCSDCGIILHIDNFVNSTSTSDGKNHICKMCTRIIQHLRREDRLTFGYKKSDWIDTLNRWTVDNKITCAYCGVQTSNPTMEHVVPFSKGGKFIKNNIIPICGSCNSSKRDKSLDEFFICSGRMTPERYGKVKQFISQIV